MLFQSVPVWVALVLAFSVVRSLAQYSAGLLPLISDMSVCAIPPDGDDACTLADCCSSWVDNLSGSVQISSGLIVDCSSVVCPNVCRMVCEQSLNNGECSANVCGATPTSEAYVFIRSASPTVLGVKLGHVGFGFSVKEGFYVYGGLEDPDNQNHSPGQDNGFWILNGTFNDMLCDMGSPPISGASPYDTNYKKQTGASVPFTCSAVSRAESVYGQGYSIIQFGNLAGNCLDATYEILLAYGATGMKDPSSGTNGIPNTWYGNLDSSWVQSSFAVPNDCVPRDINCDGVLSRVRRFRRGA